MANLVMRNRFSKQFYDGKSWNTPSGEDYSDRKNKIQEEVDEAINYMKSIKLTTDIGELNVGFIKKLITAINSSLKNEKLLYENLGLSDYPKRININNIDQFESKMLEISDLVTKSFNPPDSDKIMFLSLLNNKDFLSQVVSETITQMSYTALGEGNRNKGKTIATNALSHAMKSGISLENRYSILKTMLEKDFNQYFMKYSQQYDLPNQIGENTNNLINKIITETLDNHFKNSGLMRIQNSQRMKKLNSKETEVKAFYKDLYRRFEKAFIKSGQEIATRRVQKYLGQSLILSEKIEDTPFGEEVLLNFYSIDSSIDPSGNKLGSKNLNLTYDSFLNNFVSFLQRQVDSFTASNPEYAAASKYINNSKIRGKIFNILKRAYSKGATDEEKISNFMQFSKSNVSGLFGEIAASISFSIGTNRAIISGGEKNKLGQKISTDVKLTIYNKKEGNSKSVKNIIGIQVKNYTSTNYVSLYGDTNVGFNNESLSRYIPRKDLRVLQFLIANANFINDKGMGSISKEDLQNFLYVHFPNFLRIIDLKEDVSEETTQNSFYYINNKIFPASYILALMLRKVKETLNKAKKNSIFIIEGDFPQYDSIDPEIVGHSYQNLSKTKQQPYAVKIGRDGKKVNAPAFAFIGPDGGTYPNEVGRNLLSNLKIRFKGITIKIF